RTATSGAAYWAASVRHGPPWPLPTSASATSPFHIIIGIIWLAADSARAHRDCGYAGRAAAWKRRANPYRRSCDPPSLQISLRGHGAAASGQASRRGIASGCRLHHNRSGHVRMERAEVLIHAGRRERERVLVVGIERLRFE